MLTAHMHACHDAACSMQTAQCLYMHARTPTPPAHTGQPLGCVLLPSTRIISS